MKLVGIWKMDGVVDAVVGDQFSVTFETANGPLKVVCHKTCLLPTKAAVEEGMTVNASGLMRFTVTPVPAEPMGSALPDFRGRAEPAGTVTL
jgi:hypothetical protein